MFQPQKVPFVKMQGLGNDFVIIDERHINYAFSHEDRVHIADRRIGVGCDQLIFLRQPMLEKADIYIDMYSQDGTPLEACGNGTRCVAQWLGKPQAVIQTVRGLLDVTLAPDGMVTVNMGRMTTDWRDIPLAQSCEWDEIPDLNIGYDLPQGYAVSIGNPHIVFIVDDVMSIPLEEVGPKIEYHPFFPNRIFAEFVQIIDENHARMRVWERGVGVTKACGSGACATAYVLTTKTFIPHSTITIQMDGGDLQIENTSQGMMMRGPAEFVFEGEYFKKGAQEKRKTA